MKRLIIDIPDEYAGAVSVTAIGVGQVGMRSELEEEEKDV